MQQVLDTVHSARTAFGLRGQAAAVAASEDEEAQLLNHPEAEFNEYHDAVSEGSEHSTGARQGPSARAGAEASLLPTRSPLARPALAEPHPCEALTVEDAEVCSHLVDIHERDDGASVHSDYESAGSSAAPDANPEVEALAAAPPKSEASSDSSSFICLICLEPMDLADNRRNTRVQALGCQCKGAAAYRHKQCLDRWVRLRRSLLCDVCRSQMTSVSLPPPPPVAGYVVFPDLEHSFEVQWTTFRRYLWQQSVASLVCGLVLAIVCDIKLSFALGVSTGVILILIIRYMVSVAINYAVGRTVLTFQTPDM